MTLVTISCPTTWYIQCDWIEANCPDYVDETCWAGWQIGYNDIHFRLHDEDAVLFKLLFG